MNKPVVVLCAAAVAICGTYSVVNRSHKQKEALAANAPAAAGDIVIAPSSPLATNVLTARFEKKQGLGAAPEACQWFVNDAPVAGATTATLETGHFRKGDAVRVESTSGGSKVVSETIVIGNSPPRVASATLLMNEEGRVDIKFNAIDPDNDALAYTYEWFKNGTRIEGQSDDHIDASLFKKDDSIHATVAVTDNEIASTPRKTGALKFGSDAPKITSMPPTSLEEGRVFVYQVKVSSSSQVRYELAQAPSGMTIDKSGRIEWTVPSHDSVDDTREHKAIVRVTDAKGGSSTQEFSITTSIQASSTAGE